MNSLLFSLVCLLSLLCSLSLEQSTPSVQAEPLKCLNANGVYAKIPYTFSGASDFYWVGLYPRDIASSDNPITWAWTCPMTVFGCSQKVATGQGKFFVKGPISGPFELRMLSKANLVVARSAEFSLDCGSSANYNVTISHQCPPSSGNTCFSSIGSALQVVGRSSGSHLTFNFDSGIHCAEDLVVNLKFSSVVFQGSTTGQSVIQYCSKPPVWPSSCTSGCYLGSKHFKVESNGVSFQGLYFDGSGASGNPSSWDSVTQVVGGFAVTNWNQGSSNEKRVEQDIVPISNFIVQGCTFSYYETAAISLIEAQFSIENNYFYNMGTGQTHAKKQASSGVPLFSGNSQGGSGVKAKKGTGKCTRNQVDRSESGIEISDSDFDNFDEGNDTTTVRNVVSPFRSTGRNIDISLNQITRSTFGIAVGYTFSSTTLGVSQNTIRSTVHSSLYLARVNSSLLINNNIIEDSSVGNTNFDIGDRVVFQANQFSGVETGTVVQSCSEFFGPSSLGNPVTLLSQTSVTSSSQNIAGTNTAVGFVVDTLGSHPKCTSPPPLIQLKLDECETGSSVATAARGGSAAFSDAITLYALPGVETLFQASEGAAKPVWTVSPCGSSNCTGQGSCAGVGLCQCTRDESNLALFVGNQCDRPAGKSFMEISGAMICNEFDEFVVNLTVYYSTSVGTWVGIYGAAFHPDFPPEFLARFQISGDGPKSVQVPGGDFSGYYAVMYSGGTTVNPVAKSPLLSFEFITPCSFPSTISGTTGTFQQSTGTFQQSGTTGAFTGSGTTGGLTGSGTTGGLTGSGTTFAFTGSGTTFAFSSSGTAQLP